MRSLLFHCKNYGVKIGKLANRPEDIIPEEVSENEQKCSDCVVALITIEKNNDTKKTYSGLSKEIAKMCQEIGHKNIVILPMLIFLIILQKQKME